MKIDIISYFRNAQSIIPRYIEQMDALHSQFIHRPCDTHLILGYGDSTDGTSETLFEECSHRFSTTLTEVSHGGLHYGSIVHPERFRNLAFVANKLMRSVRPDADMLFFIESDLIWNPAQFFAIVNGLFFLETFAISKNQQAEGTMIGLAPMICEYKKDIFYDVWAFRHDGMHFTKEPPFSWRLMSLQKDTWLLKNQYLKMDSVGSFVGFKVVGNGYQKLNGIIIPPEDVIVGLCNFIRAEGGSIWMDSKTYVEHP